AVTPCPATRPRATRARAIARKRIAPGVRTRSRIGANADLQARAQALGARRAGLRRIEANACGREHLLRQALDQPEPRTGLPSALDDYGSSSSLDGERRVSAANGESRRRTASLG